MNPARRRARDPWHREVVRWIVLPIVLLAGCVGETEVVSLADLKATMYMSPSERDPVVGLETSAASVPCPVLPDGTTATLDGELAELTLGGYENPHGEIHCHGAYASWLGHANMLGASTIVFDDGDTSLTFVVRDASAQRTFALIAPTTGTLTSGDVVTMRMSPASGTLTNARVYALSGQVEYFKVDQMSGLVVMGNEIRFTMPTVRAATTTLTAAADLELAVDRCDAPFGCNTTGVISSSQPITLAP